MTKRIAAVLSTVVLGAALLTACGDGAQNATALTLVTWGGTTADGIRSAIADPFTKASGIPTNVTEPVDYGKYTAMVQQNQVTWDWVDLEAFFVVEHLDWWAPTDTEVVKIDPGDVVQLPGSQGLGTRELIPASSYAFAIAYRTEGANAHPTTWAEFFDTARFPGKRAVYNSPYGMLEAALLADGVGYDDLYPLDVARAERKLDSIRDDLVFWNSGAELQQIMTSGEADYAFAWNNRIADIQKKGAPVAIEWNQNLQDANFNVTAKNGPRVAETMKYFAFAAQPQVQADYARATGYSPASKAAFALLPDADKPHFNVYPENMAKSVGSINLDWWSKNYDDTVAQWTTWAGQ
ncbi:extracellular solute-binding protein [Mycolicibacterium sp. BiH015]|uniref:extracellular solute-binding protein n=1 Tax=Mycolicibacterium sp. BiH015 TaxID=3018808 RepID=UPI0022E05B03|nr:extracellular solute-binding protein [Mycolicibacterium sp. BiH015]MDA2893312.1 extracellular solute-binding protein [Mycolicibacterium sp. BiH015]